ncbi:MAG: 2-ketoglutarate ferredoxin oxidoreductase subunit delta [Ignavibacteria bacterium]|nr:2-ketoglutarate ferredoxin oxidoreductase subunit delta [Ignavibacteria bacterium]
MGIKRKKIEIEIDERLCKGCDICVILCSEKVFTISKKINSNGYYVPIPSNIENCNGCLICELICPELAVILEKTELDELVAL